MFNLRYKKSIEHALYNAAELENDREFSLEAGLDKLLREVEKEPNDLMRFFVLKRMLRDVYTDNLDHFSFPEVETKFLETKKLLEENEGETIHLIIPNE